jgi:hypothetical protein
MPLDQHTIQKLFFGTWIALFIGSMVFARMASPQLKRKMQPILAVGVGLVFLIFVYLLAGIRGFNFAVIPVVLIMYLNAKAVKICPQCGTTNRSPYIFPPPKYCLKCGSGLDAGPGR